jgi:copper(I)-binding protein
MVLAVFACGMSAGTAAAAQRTQPAQGGAADVHVDDAYIVPYPKTPAAYATITNSSDKVVNITAVDSACCASVSMNEMEGPHRSNIAKSILIRPHSTLVFKNLPEVHFLLWHANPPVESQKQILLTLHFGDDSTLQVPFVVRAASVTSPAANGNPDTETMPVLKQDPDLKPPLKMRLCVAGTSCANLTWAGDHYDGRLDNAKEISSRYWVRVWKADHVEFTGQTTAEVAGGFQAEGKFRGKVSAQGGRIDDGVDEWKVGPSSSGTLSFTLTWDKASIPP